MESFSTTFSKVAFRTLIVGLLMFNSTIVFTLLLMFTTILLDGSLLIEVEYFLQGVILPAKSVYIIYHLFRDNIVFYRILTILLEFI